MDPEVREWHQVLLVDGVPDPQLGGDAPAEVAEDVQAVGSLRRGGHAEQLAGPEAGEESSRRRARRRGGTRRR